ncbi:hypothetical protein AYR62_06065 [Secundilactobacillus paracollinoides]|uniref:Uncharacterized protein n=1 Tax=Secundilactobacillus paracollinoides TaxID=240427 RepID=A0A1B2J0Z3_9LACO|nr:hypothetical protein [Secundilactobacillus paracollinoides]ANZ62016.1 hypothetical protein AYR61_12075 [Secundilactobacillus paracollinoides]ANZ63703.1 hypothetical protein AYR62_06065 [Secundilactobacillus paracollinoides]ANZ67962.1 hypothetical protein AYR63_12970 [Secundilactobacillus paracollinoides]
MRKQAVISSWVTAICLCITTVLSAVFQQHVTYMIWINMISYLGVYGICIFLSKNNSTENNSTEKIVLTLVDILAIFMMASWIYMAVQKFSVLGIILIIIVGLVGIVGAAWSIFANNKFQKIDSDTSN